MLATLRPWAVALALAAGCGNGPSKEQCGQLLDHLVDLEFKKAGTADLGDQAKAELAKQKQAAHDAKADEFIEACVKKTSRARVECALNAQNLDKDLPACDEIAK